MSIAQNNRPLAITMGCPVGIGPEILVQCFHDTLLNPKEERASVFLQPPVVVGNRAVMERAAGIFGFDLPFVSWKPGIPLSPETIAVYEVGSLSVQDLSWGQPDAQTGQAQGQYIEAAVALVQAGHCAGLVTCPIHKASFQAGGYHFPGHTEMLAALTETEHYGMMMAGTQLSVVLATIHEPLAQVSRLLCSEQIIEAIKMTHAALHVDFGIASPRIAVAALNPHGGENSMFGTEETEIIAPAIQACKELGMDTLRGPYPPDTVFYKAAHGEFDAVVAMYHDQGLIPFKLLHFHDGVNVTLGLPLVRTSVDHGTAYDIAGQGKADPSSLIAAVQLGQRIVQNRIRFAG